MLRRRLADTEFVLSRLKVLHIRPGGVAMLKRHVVETMRADVSATQRTVFRMVNPPKATCPNCSRSFGLK